MSFRILGQAPRRDYQPIDHLRAYFENSLGGKVVTENIERVIQWLCEGQRLLAWQDDEKGIGATALGKAVANSSIPLEVGAGLASLIRDLLSIDDEDKILAKWSLMDTLIVLEMLNPREKSLRRFSKNMAEQVDGWIESSDVKPIIFTEWIRGTDAGSKAEEVTGSPGLELKTGKQTVAKFARQYAYGAVMRSIVIYQLGNGISVRDLVRRWRVKGLDGIEERWRDHLLWLLAGVAEILDIRCFYYFLKEECVADAARIARVKKNFRNMQTDVFRLMGLLRFCSPLARVSDLF